MDLRHLRAFVAVAEELHFGRAARRLYVAQPAVSQLVRGLEAELGVTLFERTSRRVSLTWAGQVLLEEARDLLAREALLAERMTRIRAGETGEVSLGTIPALPPDLLPGLLTELRDELPDVHVVARSLPPGLTAAAALDRPDVDIALLRGEVTDPGISIVEVARERVGVALPAMDPLATRSSLVACRRRPRRTSLRCFSAAIRPDRVRPGVRSAPGLRSPLSRHSRVTPRWRRRIAAAGGVGNRGVPQAAERGPSTPQQRRRLAAARRAGHRRRHYCSVATRTAGTGQPSSRRATTSDGNDNLIGAIGLQPPTSSDSGSIQVRMHGSRPQTARRVEDGQRW